MAISCNSQDATAAVIRPNTISYSGNLSLHSGLELGGFIDVAKLTEESPLVLVGKRSCTMRIVAEKLLHNLGTNPVLVYFDEDDETTIRDQLVNVHGVADGSAKLQFPAVFMAGRLLGGVEELISTHIAGALMPMLKEANALWV